MSDVLASDVDISVRFKPVSGRVDQAAGLVWRFANDDNYDIVRANALQDNVVRYTDRRPARVARVKAHLLVAFLGYALWVTLKHLLHRRSGDFVAS